MSGAMVLHRVVLAKIRRLPALEHRRGCDQHDKKARQELSFVDLLGRSRQHQPMRRDRRTSPSFQAECNCSRITLRSDSSIVFCCIASCKPALFRVWYPRPAAYFLKHATTSGSSVILIFCFFIAAAWPTRCTVSARCSGDQTGASSRSSEACKVVFPYVR